MSSSVREGAVWGAIAGAATGSALGYAVSNEALLGSPVTDKPGDMSLGPTESTLAGLLVGTVFGAIVGSIVGHHAEDPVQAAYDERQLQQAASSPNSAAEDALLDEGEDEAETVEDAESGEDEAETAEDVESGDEEAETTDTDDVAPAESAVE